MMLSILGALPSPVRLAPPRRRLELRLLDEVAVLVRDQVALDLTDRIHGHVDDDQQAGPAEPEVEARLRREDLGDEADQHEVGGADYGDAVQQIIEIGLRRLARADAGDETAVPLEVVGRFLAVELHRGVEKTEEGDAETV